MQNIVIDKPYRFVPPSRSRIWPALLRPLVMRHLRRTYGVTSVENHGVEHLRESLAAGHGILLTPNHCRDCDPLVLGPLTREIGTPFYLMASWHLFMRGRAMAFILNRAGAFSIYREGMDKAAVMAATEILENAERPLVLFPEGAVSGSNDRLCALLEGTALIARTAAKKRAKMTPPRRVVVHPVAIRYKFEGDLAATLIPVLDEIEARLTWQPQRHLTLIERIQKVGLGLLALKEVEYLGSAQAGTVKARLDRLIDHLLVPLEAQWCGGQREAHIVGRVKRIRTAMLPDLIKGEIDEAERKRRWRFLANVYLAQQLANYPPEYILETPTAERLLETVERFEEGMTDWIRPHGPKRAIVTVGKAIEVSPAREGRGLADPLMRRIEEDLGELLGICEGEMEARETEGASMTGG